MRPSRKESTARTWLRLSGGALALAAVTLAAHGYTTRYEASVSQAEGAYAVEGGAVGYAWRNLGIAVNGDTVQVSFDLRVWNNVRTPITQLYVCVNNKVYACVFNRVPRSSAREGFGRVVVAFRVNYPSENQDHAINLIQTQTMSVQAGQNHIEVEGGGWRSQIGTLSTR